MVKQRKGIKMNIIFIEDPPEITEDNRMIVRLGIDNDIRKISQEIEAEIQPENDADLMRANATSKYVRPVIVADKKYGKKLRIGMKSGGKERLKIPKKVEFDLKFFYFMRDDGTIEEKLRYEILLWR